MKNSQGPSSFDALQEVWSRRKWPAIAVLAAAFTSAAGVSLTLPDIYRSTATVLVKREHVSEALVKPSVTEELESRLRTIGQEILSRSRLMHLSDPHGLYPASRASAAPEALVET